MLTKDIKVSVCFASLTLSPSIKVVFLSDMSGNHFYETRYQMAQHGRGTGRGGRGGHRDNHDRIHHPGDGAGANKYRSDDAFKKEIIDGVVAKMSEIFGPALAGIYALAPRNSGSTSSRDVRECRGLNAPTLGHQEG